MSRIARKPLTVPAGVTIKHDGNSLAIKGKKGDFTLNINQAIDVVLDNNSIKMSLKNPANSEENSILGTTVILLKNMITGVNEGFEKKLQLIGVGYRAKAQGSQLELTLGYSHPVVYTVPQGITVETPSNTEIVVKGISKELVGQTAAEIRKYRAPESYKGKGIRYFGENIIIKETKKK